MSSTIRLQLALERDAEPIQGVLTGQDNRSRRFAGYTSLISAIELVLDRARIDERNRVRAQRSGHEDDDA